MKLTVTDGNSVTTFDVENDQLIEDIKALVEAEVISNYDNVDGNSI